MQPRQHHHIPFLQAQCLVLLRAQLCLNDVSAARRAAVLGQQLQAGHRTDHAGPHQFEVFAEQPQIFLHQHQLSFMSPSQAIQASFKLFRER